MSAARLLPRAPAEAMTISSRDRRATRATRPDMPAALRRDRSLGERRQPSSEVVAVAPASVRLSWTSPELVVLVVLVEVNGKAVDVRRRVVQNGGLIRIPNDALLGAGTLYWKVRVAAAYDVLETLAVGVEIRPPLVDVPVELRAHRLGLTGDTFVLEHGI